MLTLGLQILIGAPPAAAADCGQPPHPERPGSGLVGAIDPPHPLPTTSDPSRYDLYGYAGLVWHIHETACGPLDALNGDTSGLDTGAGNFFFKGAKLIVGITNSLDRTITDNSLLQPIYSAVRTGAGTVYNNIYVQLIALGALALGLIMMRAVWRGDLASISRKTLLALGGLWLAASSVVLLRYLNPVDHAIVGFTTDIQAGFISDSDLQPGAVLLPDALHEQIIYNGWLRGEFGSPTAPKADQFGKQLLDAQAFTVIEAPVREPNLPEQAVIDGKKQQFTAIAKDLGPSTDTFTGRTRGRTGAGLLALLQSIAYALFPLLAKLTVLLAQVIFRLVIILSPMLGLVALVHPDVLRTLARVSATVLFNLFVVSVFAGVHTLVLQAVFAAKLPVTAQLAIAGITTGLLLGVARPIRRLRQTLQASALILGKIVPVERGRIPRRFNSIETVAAERKYFNRIRNAYHEQLAAADKSTPRKRAEEEALPLIESTFKNGGSEDTYDFVVASEVDARDAKDIGGKRRTVIVSRRKTDDSNGPEIVQAGVWIDPPNRTFGNTFNKMYEDWTRTISDAPHGQEYLVESHGAKAHFDTRYIEQRGKNSVEVLVDAKGRYRQFIDKQTGDWRPFFSESKKAGLEGMLKAARRQVLAADGRPVEWWCAEAEVADLLNDAFLEDQRLAGRIGAVHKEMPKRDAEKG